VKLDRILAPYSPPQTNLVDALRYWTERQAGQVALASWTGEEIQGQWTYGELELRARTVAARLQEIGVRGERVLLLYPPGLDFAAGLFGCFYAGAIAVPAFPPRRNRTRRLGYATSFGWRQIVWIGRMRRSGDRRRCGATIWLCFNTLPDQPVRLRG
jgi:non-ribosomal peptide synthetase component E (peptide arylation enzyme)